MEIAITMAAAAWSQGASKEGTSHTLLEHPGKVQEWVPPAQDKAIKGIC